MLTAFQFTYGRTEMRQVCDRHLLDVLPCESVRKDGFRIGLRQDNTCLVTGVFFQTRILIYKVLIVDMLHNIPLSDGRFEAWKQTAVSSGTAGRYL